MNSLPLKASHSAFLEKYETAFLKATGAVNYLCTYPNFKLAFPDFEKLSPERWLEFQAEWLRVMNHLIHPIDLEFFKASIIPADYKSFTYFIDLDDPDLGVFGLGYSPLAEYPKWYKYSLFSNLIKVTSSDISEINFNRFVEFSKSDSVRCLQQINDEYQAKLYSGEISIPEISNNVCFNRDSESSAEISDGQLKLNGILPLIVTILPHDLKINFSGYHQIDGILDKDKQVNEIRHLLILLKKTGYVFIEKFNVDFIDKPGFSLQYSNEQMIIKHSNQQFLAELLERFNNFKTGIQ